MISLTRTLPAANAGAAPASNKRMENSLAMIFIGRSRSRAMSGDKRSGGLAGWQYSSRFRVIIVDDEHMLLARRGVASLRNRARAGKETQSTSSKSKASDSRALFGRISNSLLLGALISRKFLPCWPRAWTLGGG